MLLLYKDGFEYRLGAVLGDLLGQHCAFQFVLENIAIDIVTWIPPTAHALRRRGYDHAGVLAHGVARHLGVEAQQYLVRKRMRDLRTLSREQRWAEVQGSFAWKELAPEAEQSLSGRHVLIVDDVLTTGATLEGAAQMFQGLGAAKVTGAVLARAW